MKVKTPGNGIFDHIHWWAACGIRKALHWWLCTYGKKPPKGQRPAPQQEQEYQGVFPKLTTWSVTGPPDLTYNCVAWTLGKTNQFLWPGETIVKFDSLYTLYGWKVATHCEREYKKRKIALYGFNAADCRHVSIESHDCGWHESKLGGGVRIMHLKHELEGGQWGNIIRAYERKDDIANLDLC